MFLEDGAYTTVTSAVAILVVFTLVFSSTTAVWSMSRAGDVQATADITALAGANVVSSYRTTATVVDASILSLGLTGFCVTGVGLVALLIPGAEAAAGKTVDCGINILRTRNKFATSASKGLQKLEKGLPVLVATSSVRACSKQKTDKVSYTGVAVPVPLESASDFAALEGDQIDTDSLEDASDKLDEVARELAKASEKTAKAKEEAWIADCGREGMNMQERAAKLTSLSGAENPDYSSSITWDPNAALDRTRAYYRWRYENDRPNGQGVEARADAAARHAFYGYAKKKMADARVVEQDGVCKSNVELLPKNTAEVKGTELYTDAVWPTTMESGMPTLHFDASCPGAKGARGQNASLASIDSGASAECGVCRFGVGDVGKTPAASTSINNGYEYHLREYTEALKRYVTLRNKELELERQAKNQAENASNTFKDGLSKLVKKRPRIAPPGRYGCVGVVAAGDVDSPEQLQVSFTHKAKVPMRGAVSAAVLAPDPATKENNVLASFFSSLKDRSGGGGVPGLLNDVMGLWGKILISYGNLNDNLGKLMEKLTGGLTAFGLGPIAKWLSKTVDGVVSGLDFEPVDLSLYKPVLTDSAHVLAHTDVSTLSDAQGALRSLPIGTTDPKALLQALHCKVEEYVMESTFTIAEIPIPGGGSIPLTVRVKDLISGGA